MPRTKLQDAVLFFERIRKAIECLNHTITGKQAISIGAAERFKDEAFSIGIVVQIRLCIALKVKDVIEL